LLVEDLLAQMTKARVPPSTRRMALMLLQGILGRAVVRGLIPGNPVHSVRKPGLPPTRPPQPLAPETVERIRRNMLSAWSSPHRGAGRPADELGWWRQRNALIVSMLAYAGLRPVEDRGSTWEDLHARTVHVVASKTGRTRDVDDWKLHEWQNWRRRVYQPAAKAVGVTGDLRVYRLRGSFVSLLLWEGRSLTFVADQAGHSVATLAKHHAGVLEELEDKPRI
jgi:integrase